MPDHPGGSIAVATRCFTAMRRKTTLRLPSLRVRHIAAPDWDRRSIGLTRCRCRCPPGVIALLRGSCCNPASVTLQPLKGAAAIGRMPNCGANPPKKGRKGCCCATGCALGAAVLDDADAWPCGALASILSTRSGSACNACASSSSDASEGPPWRLRRSKTCLKR